MKKDAIVINGLGNAEYDLSGGTFKPGKEDTRKFAHAAQYTTDSLQGVSVMIAYDATEEAIKKAIEWLRARIP